MPSILETDGYKFSMAQAGFPLRNERFYFSFRRGGWHYNPFDLKEMVTKLAPTYTEDELAYLADHNYRLTESMRQALHGKLEVEAIPKDSWFCNQEPILSVSAPSFLVSHIEANVTRLNYMIQLATDLVCNPKSEEPIKVINDAHRELVREVFDAVKIVRPIEDDAEYPQRVLKAIREVVDSLEGGSVDLRIVEGGLRSAICDGHHQMILEACKEMGITRTSNVAGARALGLVPSGTAGHEHSQRCGSDRVAYMNYADRVCGLVSCLSDTWSTLNSGLPETVRITGRRPNREFLYRLDSGDRPAYFHISANTFKEHKRDNVVINVAGDVNAAMIRGFEPLRKIVGWDANRLSFMIGGQITAETLPTPLTRSKVAAVFKLCDSDGPTMKQGDDVGVGKRSWPGAPTTFRRLRGDGPIGIVGQRGEKIENYADMHADEAADQLRICNVNQALRAERSPHAWSERSRIPETVASEQTQALIKSCTENR